MEFVKVAAYALVPMGIIFVIVNNIIPNNNHAKKAALLGIVLAGFMLLFGGAMIFDRYRFGTDVFKHYQYYLAIGALTLIFTSFIIFHIVMAVKQHHHLFSNTKRVNKDLSQYLYIVYRYGGMYYLKKEDKNGSDYYSGECVSFDRSNYFYDDAFTKYITKMHINIKDYSYIGQARLQSKKQTIFYCFLAELADEENIDHLERISPYEIVSLNMVDLHKTLIMHILVGESFNIEL